MTYTAHRIGEDGRTIVCDSAPDTDCRMTPDCDAETWDADGCHDHRDHEDNPDGHPITPGHPCWITEGHINQVGLKETHDDWAEALDSIDSGAAVDLTFHGPDMGCTWTYKETGQ